MPTIRLFSLQEANRLANGDTVITSWCPNAVKDPKDWGTTVQALEVSPDKKVVWALRSWDEPANLGTSTTLQILDAAGMPDTAAVQ